MIDLTETQTSNERKQETVHAPQGDNEIKKEGSNKDRISKKEYDNSSINSLTDSAALVPQQDCGDAKCVNSQTQPKKENYELHPNHHTPAVKLRRLSFLETHVNELKMSNSSLHSVNESPQMSPCLGQLGINRDAPECDPKLSDSLIRQEQEENGNGLTSSQLNDLGDHPSSSCPTTTLHSSEIPDSLSHSSPASHDLNCNIGIAPSSEDKPTENMTELQSDETRAAPNSPYVSCSITSEPALSVSKTGATDEVSGDGTYRGDGGMDSPLSFLWQEGSDVEEVNEDSRFDMDFRAASREDRRYVCSNMLRKIMSGPGQALVRDHS